MKSESNNLYAAFRDRFPTDLGATFIQTEDDRVYSYRDLDKTSAKTAAAMESMGVKLGDRVAVQIEKSAEAVFLYLACIRMGAIYLPLNTAYSLSELKYFSKDAEPRLFVATPDTAATIERVLNDDQVLLTLDQNGRGSLAEKTEAATDTGLIAPVEANDVASIVYTSGTTGRPKGAMITHQNLAFHAQTLHKLWGFVPGEMLLHTLPIYHVHGLFIAINCVLWNGSGMRFLEKFDADAVLKFLPECGVMMGVPTFYSRLLANEAFDAEVCSKTRLFISGSAPLLANTFDAFQKRTGHTILERYGMTETGMITSNPLDGDRVAGSVGFALPGVEVRIADESGEVVDDGETGILELRGENVFQGYWRQPEKTKQEFRPDGYFISGDLAKKDKSGRVAIVGREKDLIITGGLNVYPKEVELEIDRIKGVDECAVIGLPHADFGEAVTAIVRRDARLPSIEETEITDALKARIAGFKQPKRVLFIDDLPRNAMGKVQKNLLREQFSELYD